MREARLAGSDWVKSILGGLDEHVVRGKRERERERAPWSRGQQHKALSSEKRGPVGNASVRTDPGAGAREW